VKRYRILLLFYFIGLTTAAAEFSLVFGNATRSGYFEPNRENAYTINNLTAKRDPNGSISIQFCGCDGKTANCLPITDGWNYLVRLYRPREEVLNG
jgi:hypothetical protein